MGKKKQGKPEKEKKKKEKLKKPAAAGQKTAGSKKDKLKKKDRKPEAGTAGSKPEAAGKKPVEKAVGRSSESRAKGTAGRPSGSRTKDMAGDKLREMAERFRALGDKNRLQILALLADRELCAGDILGSMDIAQSTLSHHMKILTEAGIVKCRKQGKWSYYSVDRKLRTELKRLAECGSAKDS